MHNTSHWFLERFVRDHDNTEDPEVRARYGALAGWASIFTNVLLFALKLVLGYIAGSVAVLADALHTLSDVASSVVLIVGVRAAAKPSDARHPFGHGRMESVTALVMAVLLIVTAIEVGRHAIDRLSHPGNVYVAGWLLAVVALTAVAKEVLARFTHYLAHRIESHAIEADTWHHRADALSSLLVIGALIAARAGYPWADAGAGLVVALFVAYAGYTVARNAVHPLLGEPASPELVREIDETGRAVDGVRALHDVVVHRYGSLRLITLHIEVFEHIPTETLHDITEEVERRLDSRFGGKAVVHADPMDTAHAGHAEMDELLREIVREEPLLEGYHHLHVTAGEPRRVSFHLKVAPGLDEEQSARLLERVHAAIRERCPWASPQGSVDHTFADTPQ